MKKSRRTFMQQTGALAGGALVGGLTPAAAAPQGAVSALPLSRTQKLRALLKKPGAVMLPECSTIPAARLAEIHGFEAIGIGGSMLAGTYLGVPDFGVITTTDFVNIAGPIARSISIPAIVDADMGGETAINVRHTVQQYEAAGFAAMHIEDTINPKHAFELRAAGRNVPVVLQSTERMVLRIRAAVEARRDPNFVIIARSDEENVENLIRRGQAFAKAGADVFMPFWGNTHDGPFRGPGGAERLWNARIRVANEVPLPQTCSGLSVADQTAFRKAAPKTTILMQYPGLVSGPAMALANTILLELKEHGVRQSRPERRLSRELTHRVKDWDQYAQLAEKWAATP
jgi:hypothetical protein